MIRIGATEIWEFKNFWPFISNHCFTDGSSEMGLQNYADDGIWSPSESDRAPGDVEILS